MIEAGWELDLFGRLKAGRAAAGARLDAATADAAATRLALESDLARNLVAVRTLDARRASALQALDAARALDRLARVRAEAGLATGLDTATTAADVAAAEAALAPLGGERAARVAALSRLTARPSAEIAGWLAPPAPLPAGWALADIPSDLLQRRPDIAAAHARLRAADQDTAAALAARYPRLTLTGSLGWLAQTAGALFTGDALTASAGVFLAGPLLDFGRAAAEAEARKGAAAEATARYRAAVLTALAEVETELAAARAARTQAGDLGRSADALARALRLAEAQYRGGLTDARAAAEAQRRLAEARDRQLIAEGLALDAAIALELAAGGSLAKP
jgi:outer membrane protein TolC